MPNLPIHDPPAAPAVRDETDFSDITATPSSPKLPMLTAAPVVKAGAALPLDPPRPSVPVPERVQPPELQPSYGAAPAIAEQPPTAPPELAASAMSALQDAAPPTFTPRLMSAAAGVVVPSGNPADWSLAQARAALKLTVQDRDRLVSVALDYGRRAFEFVGAFAVVRGAAVGWDARAEGEPPVIRHVSIPLDAASVFRTVALTRGSYVGPLPPDALTQHYLALLGRSPRAVFLWPVEVKGRLVAMLYGDSGSKPVSQRKLNDFILFCQELPSAFGELIVFRKQRLGTSAAFHSETDALGLPAPEQQSAEPHPDAEFAQADADWFSGLLTLLIGPDPRERANSMTELSRTPDTSARALVRAFPGPTAWSRLPVTELPEVDELGPIPGALARLGRPAALALAPLLDADDSDTRYLALLTAGSLRYPELLDGVLRGLFDMEPDISSAARAAATAMKDVDGYPEAVRALRQELASRDPLRKSLAARALGMLHDREAIEGLIGLTASEDSLCSQSAAEALREICRANLGPNARQWAAWYAMARSRRRIEWLCDALDSEEFELRLSAVEELSRSFGDNLGYFADGPETERGLAVERWRSAINARPDFDL
ncbi:MAG: frgA [Myxococcaceae bacterium]|nr:frgA [Myxococcaceae bacterium]